MRKDPDFLSPDKCPECRKRMGIWLRENPLVGDVACGFCGHEAGVLNTFAEPVWLKPRLDETDHPPGAYRGFLSGLTGLFRVLAVRLRSARGYKCALWNQPTWFVREGSSEHTLAGRLLSRHLRDEAKKELALRENCVEARLGKSPWWAHAYTEDGGSQ